MKISPLDIRKQDFTRRLRGYDPEEVQAFLHTLSAQWDSVLEDARRQEERLREMEAKLRHYERVEEALQEALKTARESARQAMQAAEQKAQQIRNDAEGDADRIKRDAEQDRMRMRQETQAILGRRKEIVARLRGFLLSEMEMLAHFEGEDPIGFIKLMPAEQQRRIASIVDVEEGTYENADAPAMPPPDEAPDAPSDSFEEQGGVFAPEPEVEPAPSEFAPAQADEHDVSADEHDASAQEETMAERLLRLDQEGALEEEVPTPPREIWTATAGAEEPASSEESSPETPDVGEQPHAPTEAEESSTRPGWRQKSIIGLGGTHPRNPSETVSAAEEEIARIRRILSQLD